MCPYVRYSKNSDSGIAAFQTVLSSAHIHIETLHYLFAAGLELRHVAFPATQNDVRRFHWALYMSERNRIRARCLLFVGFQFKAGFVGPEPYQIWLYVFDCVAAGEFHILLFTQTFHLAPSNIRFCITMLRVEHVFQRFQRVLREARCVKTPYCAYLASQTKSELSFFSFEFAQLV